ncbi:unnamed protein product [Prorocentrum cordatum]|uniref:Calcineurin-like phosphoesterase domain-containing protein n=1 Tax=Prorocentrum cordatum TaxID=2364126 RepID=A0ABN9U5L7_9DINO|nr:unnamed protein product [Polarella glacialis]
MFVSGWDQALHYTWLQEFPSTNRWVTPALYYQSKVVYPDFSGPADFVDTNVWDTWLPHAEQRHNLCSRNHNPPNLEANCGAAGPVSVDECPDWFKSLWKANVEWMDNSMPLSEAEWQIVVTHFPPEGNWGGAEWARLSAQHGIDLILAGHRHRQEVHTSSQIAPTTYVVSGGGGGITSENLPDAGGDDDEYGFVDITLSRSEIMLELISHGGMIRSTTCITPRDAGAGTLNWLQEPSLCEGRPSGPQRPTQTSTTPAPPTGGDWGGDAAALPSDSDLVYSEPGPELYGPEPYPRRRRPHGPPQTRPSSVETRLPFQRPPRGHPPHRSRLGTTILRLGRRRSPLVPWRCPRCRRHQTRPAQPWCQQDQWAG